MNDATNVNFQSIARHRNLAIHILCWGLIMIVPPLLRPSEMMDDRLAHLLRSLGPTMCYMLVFYINYLLLLPRLYFKDKKTQFYLINVVLIFAAFGLNIGWWTHDAGADARTWVHALKEEALTAHSCSGSRR